MTAAITVTRTIASVPSEPTPALLKYLSELLATDTADATHVLHELARHWGARGAGIAHLLETTVRLNASAWVGADRPIIVPWQTSVGALWLLAGQAQPATLEDDAGTWLLWFDARPTADGQAILWLNDAADRRWSDCDAAALALAAQALRRVGLLSRPEGGRVEERLALAGVVTSRLSHDFGNLLTGVLGFTELALAQVPAGTRAHGYMSEVWDVARGGAEWLKKLNFFCRRNPPEFTPTGLPGALAEEEARLERGAAPAWHADIPADLPAIACDAESLRQALRQVLDNAREASVGTEAVQLAARSVELSATTAASLLGQPQPGRYVEITVADRGPGMSDDIRGRLFKDWFFSTRPRHRGMGLMMAYGIVHRFGGGLAIEPGPADGTQVRLYFPAAPEPIPAGPAHLLIVDEDPQLLTEARRILEPAGYRVQVAGSAAEALVVHQTAAVPFDLLLLAAHLPNLTGTELARRMLLRDPHARFLFLHTPAGPGLPRDELVSPANLVHKPFAAPVLLQAVAAALRRSSRPA
jgi:signal transduction histidine kinase/CheY-like chemotaxis protein